MFWVILVIVVIIAFVSTGALSYSESEKKHMDKHKKYGKMKKDKYK